VNSRAFQKKALPETPLEAPPDVDIGL
jgi:hypothetical protein